MTFARRLLLIAVVLLALPLRAELLPSFSRSPCFDEQVREQRFDDARAVTVAPIALDPHRPTLLILYALPNGNTIEQTIGCRMRDGLDWHYDIQHIGAQVRRLRELTGQRNIVVVYLEADSKSWPAWRRSKGQDNPALIRSIVDRFARDIPGEPVSIALTAHSGGGSFIFGYLNSADSIDPRVERIVLLDANYAYDDPEEHHGDKLLAWLYGGEAKRRLVVIAYDDRNVTLNGKKVVSDTGGTCRATHRMLDRFAKESPLQTTTSGDFDTWSAVDGRARFLIHRNPDLKILHTALVGEMNGFLEAMALGTPAEGTWGTFGGERAYTKWVQPEPSLPAGATTMPAAVPMPTLPTTRTFRLTTQPSRTFMIPARPADAAGGHTFMQRLALLAPADREQEIAYELSRGNVPAFLRQFKSIRLSARDPQGAEHIAQIQVAPDYLAAGSDEDWVRLPMTPLAARYIADALGCSLPTRKLVNDIYAAADVKLEPRPLTERREAVETFVQHHEIIEAQRKDAGKPLGALVAGIKKDIVLTNRLNEKPQRVAIYGWHKPDAQPIQPLTIVHKESYVDYSHGVRLVKREMLVDGKPMDYEDVLRDPNLCGLVSDEGPIDATSLYR